MSEIKRGDYVVCKILLNGPLGFVIRVARDGSWADIRWRGSVAGEIVNWSKRMRLVTLEVT